MRVGVWAVLGLSLAAALPALAQNGPAELPPGGYTGREYIDSRGCAFQRAGVSGTVVWVPRVDAENNPVCGLTPSVSPAVPAVVKAAPQGQKARHRAPAPSLLVEDESLAARQSLCPSDRGRVQRFWVSDGRRVTNCGARAADGVAFVNGLGAPGLSLSGTDMTAAAGARARALGAAGYRVTWSRGALRAGAASAGAASESVAIRSGRWVQVGAFADPANAERAVAGVGALSLPVARQALNGGRLTAVMAGPYASAAEARAALSRLRAAGYADAYLR